MLSPSHARVASRAIFVFLYLLVEHRASAEDCPAKDKAAPDELTKAGRMLLKNNQLAAARACFAKAVGLAPRYVPALLELGTLESKSKDYQDAVKHFSTALQVTGAHVPLPLPFYCSHLPAFLLITPIASPCLCHTLMRTHAPPFPAPAAE